MTVLLFLLWQTVPVLSFSSTSASTEAPHNIHVTHTQLAVDGTFVACRIKYFKHDLEEAVATFLKKDTVELEPTPAGDSMFVAYLSDRFILSSAADTLVGRVVGSGEEGEMWWYEVLYEAPSPVSSLQIANRQLLEKFRDQKNIVKATYLPTNKKRSFYFARGADEYTFQW